MQGMAVQQVVKQCRVCGAVKPVNDFYRSHFNRDGLEGSCKICSRARIEKHRTENRPEYLAGKAAYRQSHAKHRRIYNTIYRWRTIARACGDESLVQEFERVLPLARVDYYEQSKEWLGEFCERYRQIMPSRPHLSDEEREQRRKARRRKRNERRKARLMLASSTTQCSIEDWRALCEHFGMECLCCHKKGRLTPDHVIPLALGGVDHITNLQPLCNRCNTKKGASIADYRPPEQLAEFLRIHLEGKSN